MQKRRVQRVVEGQVPRIIVVNSYELVLLMHLLLSLALRRRGHRSTRASCVPGLTTEFLSEWVSERLGFSAAGFLSGWVFERLGF